MGGAETHLFRTCFLSLGFNASYSSCGIPHRLSFVFVLGHSPPVVPLANCAFQLSVGLALGLRRMSLSKSAGGLLMLEYNDNELDTVEGARPDKMECVTGKGGTRWRTPGDDEYPPGSRGDSL
jgi:hypothetical protein